ncbi:MAG: response regulator [Thermodesulfobacteriota bacterium]|nr:response regulator [Thermodesulfobacteriota bacterium]
MEKGRILIVEDEGIVAEDLRIYLEEIGHSVCAVVAYGEDAIKKAEDEKPDLILMGIMLPGKLNGIDAAYQIRSCLDIPIIYVTASSNEEIIQRAKVAEPYEYIIKPFQERELRTTIEMALYKHRMERRLKNSEQWLLRTIKSIRDGVIATDANSIIRFMNPIAQELTGWKEEDAIDLPLKEVFQIVNEKTGKGIDGLAAEVFREGNITGLANRTLLIAKDGTRWPVDNYGILIKDEKEDVIGFVLVFHDISEQRNTLKALRESEEKYRLLVENANDGITITQEGRIKYANPRLLSELGYTEEELLNIPFIDLIHHEDREMVYDRYLRRIKGEDVPNYYTFRGVSKYGEIFFAQLNAVRVSWHGKPANLSFIRDITSLRKVEAQLQQSQKMEAIGTLAGGIAHDFNNLLMGIQGHTSLMLKDISSGHSHFNHLKGIEDAVVSGSHLTRQLLGFARGGMYDVKPTDLNELIEKTSQMFARTKKEIRIHKKYQKEIWGVDADQGQIEQTMLNLFINAWQAMPDGGDISIETENTILSEDYARPFNIKPGNFVKISVADTGMGMDDATQQRIFDPFFTTKEMNRGTGLGLFSSYGIIKNHGGIIHVDSKEREGTVFIIYLPAIIGKVKKEKIELADEIFTGTFKETILLVDDEEVIIEVVTEMLEEIGYTVLSANSGKEALKLLKNNKEKIDLIILDMIMPDMKGADVCDRIKGLEPNSKILLSSGYSIDAQATRVLERGCNGFIQKPFNMELISKKIREILSGH